MEDSTLMSLTPQEVYIPQKLKAYMAEPHGSTLVAALERQFNCTISVINDTLKVQSAVAGTQPDVNKIEKMLRDMWQKRDIQLMIREAALNASCTHVCQMILPRAYCAVVFFFSSDFQRRSRCNDIIIDQFTGKVTLYGTEPAVNKAREVMIECLTEHFGLLELDIPNVRRATRVGYGMSTGLFNPEVPPPSVPLTTTPFLNNIFSMGEPNAILTSTPSPHKSNEHHISSNFDNHLLFPSEFHAPPPQLPPVQTTNNVEKVKQWIPTAEVGKILGNRASMKKQIEGQFNCVITVHTEVYSQFGMTAVEIMAQNKHQCRGAQNAVLALMQSHQDQSASTLPSADSGFNSPSSAMAESPATTPEKRGQRQYHRSGFRDQPKVMLALTPRKSSPSDE